MLKLAQGYILLQQQVHLHDAFHNYGPAHSPLQNSVQRCVFAVITFYKCCGISKGRINPCRLLHQDAFQSFAASSKHGLFKNIIALVF
jgi:hypothetical protein